MTCKPFSIAVACLMALFLTTSIVHAQEKITGPWLWMIAPTVPGQGGARSINVDSLAVASKGAVTELDVATNGANEGDRVGNFVWTLGQISRTGGDNINDCLKRIGLAAGNLDDHSAYALFTFKSDTAQRNVTMRVGSDDAVKVWLNEEVVHTQAVNRGALDFQDVFLVNLRAGENLLMVKISDRAAGWSMFVGIDSAGDNRRAENPIETPVQLQQRPVVRLIYFLPRDRHPQPDIDEKMDKLIKGVQQFYADQMEAHGFRRKTFQIETDAIGKAVVHRMVGQFTDAYYMSDPWRVWEEEIDRQFDRSKNIYLAAIEISGEIIDGQYCGRGGHSGSTGGQALIPASGGCFNISNAAHELGHTFGLGHDNRGKGTWISSSGISDRMVTSFCAAEWLDVLHAFNTGDPSLNQNTTFKMLPPSLASPPNAIRLRFDVTDPDGLHQVQLHTPEVIPYVQGGFLACKRVKGTTRTIEFVTTILPLKAESVNLQVIDMNGNISWSEIYPIDVPSLLPPPEIVSIPDPHLASAVRKEIGKSITTHTMLNLVHLDVTNRAITDLIGLEHAYNLKTLNLRGNAVSDVSPLASLTQLTQLSLWGNALLDVAPLSGLTQLTQLDLNDNDISDVSPLASLTQLTQLSLWRNALLDVAPLSGLTQLTQLHLNNNALSDVSPLSGLTQLTQLHLDDNDISDVSHLSGLTQLTRLHLNDNDISDVSPLANLTQLTYLNLWSNTLSDVSHLSGLTQLTQLYLNGNNISDVSPLANLTQLTYLNLWSNPLSHVSINIYIPAMQAKLIEVDFDNTTAKITGPWLWVIAPTQAWQGGAKSTNIDSIAIASDGALTESDVARHGAKAGDTIGKYTWMLGTISATGSNNINELINRIGLSANRYIDDHSSYALISLESATVQSGVTMRAGSDDSIKIWLNGEVVHNKPVDRGAYDFLDTFKVDLKKGDNLLFVKVSERGGDWSMFVGIEADVNAIYKSPQAPGPRVDVNGDGVVNIQDLVLISSRFGQTGQNSADVNGDGVVNISDLVLVAGAFGDGAAAAPLLHPAALEGFTAAEMQRYLMQARQMGFTDSDALRGIAVLEQLLALLLPKETSLLANYPNPFNPETWIPYQLAKPAKVTLHIYSVKGELVRTLALGHQAAGVYHNKRRAAYWDGRNAQGEKVASGVYFYTLSAGEFSATRKLMIQK